jgi:hypothetical protein
MEPRELANRVVVLDAAMDITAANIFIQKFFIIPLIRLVQISKSEIPKSEITMSKI